MDEEGDTFAIKDKACACMQCSIEDFNVFHPVTYQGRIDLEQLSDPVQRAALEVQITEFGQTPK